MATTYSGYGAEAAPHIYLRVAGRLGEVTRRSFEFPKILTIRTGNYLAPVQFNCISDLFLSLRRKPSIQTKQQNCSQHRAHARPARAPLIKVVPSSAPKPAACTTKPSQLMTKCICLAPKERRRYFVNRRTTRVTAPKRSLTFRRSARLKKDLLIASERVRARMEQEKREQDIALSRSRLLQVIVQ
jgi:hypothetical protein